MSATTQIGNTEESTALNSLCAHCAAQPGEGRPVLKRCSRCKRVSYCSAECQQKHWKTHKMLCISIDSEASNKQALEATIVVAKSNPSTGKSPSSCGDVAKFNLGQTNKKASAAAEECANCAAVGGRGGIVLSKCSKCSMVAYCSRACQMQHWKDGGHKRFCVSPSERIPQSPFQIQKEAPSSVATPQQKDDDCIICDEIIDPSNIMVLPCGHRFHAACVTSMRQFGMSLVCPLCRAPLPPESETSFEIALREYTALARQVMASAGSWTSLSAPDKTRMMEVVQRAHAAAEQGHSGAMTLLGGLYMRGEGVAQNEAEGLNWYRKASEQGYSTAQRKFDVALVEESSSSNHKMPLESQLARAQAAVDVGDFDTGAELFRRACGTDRSSARAWYGLGVCLGYGPNADAALKEREECFKRAIELKPTHVFSHAHLGGILMHKGDLTGAEKSFRWAIELDPMESSAHYNLGAALYQKEDLNGAEMSFRRAIELSPTCAKAYGNLGMIFQKKGDHNGAEKSFRRMIELDPKNAWAHSHLGKVFMGMGDLNSAEKNLRRAIEVDSMHADAHCYLGGVLQMKGDLNGAGKCFRRAVELNPMNTNANYSLGVTFLENGDLNGAEISLRRAIELSPKFARAYGNLGVVLLKKGDLIGAEKSFRRVVELDPRDCWAHSHLGNILKDMGDLDGAEKSFRQTIKLDPKNAVSYCKLGSVLFKKYDFDGAEKYCRRAVELEPTSTIIREGLEIMLKGKASALQVLCGDP